MATGRMDLSAFVGTLLAADEPDVRREGVRVLAQAVLATEVTTQVGAEAYERTGERTADRNGYRTRTWDTRVGTLELAIPKVTPGSYCPSLLKPRRRGERARVAVVQEAYVHGVSTRKVDELMWKCSDLIRQCAKRSSVSLPAMSGGSEGGSRG